MKRSLTLLRQGSYIEQATDIGEVVKRDDSELIDKICEAEMVGVKQLGSFNACVSCRGSGTAYTSRWTICGMFQRIDG